MKRRDILRLATRDLHTRQAQILQYGRPDSANNFRWFASSFTVVRKCEAAWLPSTARQVHLPTTGVA